MPPMLIIEMWREARTRRNSGPPDPGDGSLCISRGSPAGSGALMMAHIMDVGAVNHLPAVDGASPVPCANCGTPLAGRYCSTCGQRADVHAHSVGHFLHEFAEALTHADSRVWATLVSLLQRPGFLTREYFAGRRARYLEPLRVYLFMSVLFLLLSAWLGGEGSHLKVQVDQPKSIAECDQLQSNLVLGGKPMLPRLKAACRKIAADNGQHFGENMVQNLGRAM